MDNINQAIADIFLKLNKVQETNFSMKIEDHLSEELYAMEDGSCGEPFLWYRTLKTRMPEELFTQYKPKLEFCGGYDGQWIYVEKVLTREDCIEKYGEITDEEFGPRGGWKSVTFGKKKFITTKLKPQSK